MQDAADLDVPGPGSRAGRQSSGFPRSPPGAGQTASGRQVLKQCCRIQEVYPGSEFLHPGSRVEKALDPDPEQKFLGIFNPKIITKLSEI